MMKLSFKMMNSAFKMMNSAFKMMDFPAWGCIMYEMLSGTPPWFKRKEMEIMMQVTDKKGHLCLAKTRIFG